MKAKRKTAKLTRTGLPRSAIMARSAPSLIGDAENGAAPGKFARRGHARRMVSFRMREDIIEWLKRRSSENGVSMAREIEEIFVDYWRSL